MATKWAQDEIDLLREIFPYKPTKEVAEILGKSVSKIHNAAHRHGLRKYPNYIKEINQKNYRRLIDTGKSYQFPKGLVPHNKGKKMSQETFDKIKHTFFRKGSIPDCTRPIGFERRSKEGYIEIKQESGEYAYKHRLIWEAHHGKIPDKHIVMFADGNNKNYNIDNLLCIPRQDFAILNKNKKYGKEIAETALLLSKIKNHLKTN